MITLLFLKHLLNTDSHDITFELTLGLGLLLSVSDTRRAGLRLGLLLGVCTAQQAIKAPMPITSPMPISITAHQCTYMM